MIRFLAALAVALAFPVAHAAWETGSDGLAPIPPLTTRVTDLTGTLGPAESQALVDKLAAWEAKTGNQLAVLVVPSTLPEPIEAYSIRVADAWKIGRKGQDNGALLVVAKNDRKLRIEVGYGLEGSLTDVTTKRIVSDTIAPYFRDGKFAQGIDAGVDQVMAVVDKGEPLAAKPDAKPAKSRSSGISLEGLLVVVFVVVPVLGSILGRFFGKTVGSAVGAGIIGVAAWVVAGSIIIAIIAAIVALLVMLFAGAAGGLRGAAEACGRPPAAVAGGGGGGGGGGGFSGGGGGFGGGGLGKLVMSKRFWRHLFTDRGHVARAMPRKALAAVERAIAEGEARHSGQVCFAIEGSLPIARVWRKVTPRDRALEVFGLLRVWDTERNDGILVYVLLADHDVEIVADRGIDARVGAAAWREICRKMEARFRRGEFAQGAEEGVRAIGDLLAIHSPRTGGERNELPDKPIVL